MASKKNKNNNDGDTIGFGDPSEHPHGPLAEDDEAEETEEKEDETDDEDEDDDDLDDEDVESHGYHTVDFDNDEGEGF